MTISIFNIECELSESLVINMRKPVVRILNDL